MKSQVAIAAAIALTGGIAGSATAQSSVTLYGNIDVSIGYQSNQTSVGSTSNGHSVVKQNSGIWSGSRFGFKGNEDLGGGNSAQFVLEEGFNGDTGSQSVSGLMFNRQAFVGLANRELGTVTLGRQYTAYFSILAPYSPINWLTGFYGAHPGDIDSLDTNYRVNNSVVYMSPTAPQPILPNKELILMKAEILWGQNNMAGALQLSNFVRQQDGKLAAVNPTQPADVLTEILKQKRYSLLYESADRWIDARMFGRMADLGQERGFDPIPVLPIPSTEVDARNGSITKVCGS